MLLKVSGGMVDAPMSAMRHPVATLNAPPHAVAPLWTVPSALVKVLESGRRAELLYVHLQFSSDANTVPPEAHEHAILVAAHTARAWLCRETAHFGLVRCPPHDLVAWVSRSDANTPVGFEHALAAAIRDALSSDATLARIAGRVFEVNVATLPIAHDVSADFAFASALRRASRAACDPLAREVQRSQDLIDEAIAKLAFCFHYQPIVDVATGSTIAYEALCRGLLEGLRFPDVIFSTAERTGRVWELGRALRDLAASSLHDATAAGEDSQLFLNVHPSDIEDPVFLEQAMHGPLSLYANRVVIELTERAAIADYRRVKNFFSTLRARGFRLAIDDLGSGYAGLTALAELEPDFIKFDMGLIRDLHCHPIKRRLIGRMNDFALEIGAVTISEGVETREERDALLDAGCTKMQGYYFARPAAERASVPAERFEASVRATASG